jgi:hypothetical protein
VASDSVGTISIVVYEDSGLIDKNDICTKLVKFLMDFSSKLGTYFEPEQELDIRPIRGAEYSFDIVPVFVKVSATETGRGPECIFHNYMYIMMKCFFNILKEQSLSEQIYIIEKLRGPLLETETMMIYRSIKSCRKKIMRLSAKFDFTYNLHGLFFDFNKSQTLVGLDTNCEARNLIAFDNYEFDYELDSFMFIESRPSCLLIGGRSYEVYFDDDFINEFLDFILDGTLADFEAEVSQISPICKVENCKIKKLSFSSKVPSIVRYQNNDHEIICDKSFLVKSESLFRNKVGPKILLRDRYEERKIGDFYKGSFYQSGVRSDRKTCFEFISRTR